MNDQFEELLALQEARKLPPVESWKPSQTGIIDINIDRAGNWFHEGVKITRQPLVNLFATILIWEDGDFFLITPVEKMKIQVENTPFLVIDMEVRGSREEADILLSTNVGEHILVDANHPVYMFNNEPIFLIRSKLEARILTSVFYRLVEIGVEESNELVVYSQGNRFCLGSTI
mgnify:FL=1